MTYSEIRNRCIEALIEALQDDIDCYCCDLHNEVFNMDPVISVAEAEELLSGTDGYKIIGEIISYELNCFGEVFPEDIKRLQDAHWLGNMIVYIKGDELIQELLSECQEFYDAWDSTLDKITRRSLYTTLKRLQGGK